MAMYVVQSPAPGSITAARIIGWIQAGLAAVATAIVIIATIAFNRVANDANADSNSAFSGVTDAATGLLVVFIVILAALTAAIMIPLIRLKPGHPGAGTGLVVVESVFLFFDVISLAQDNSSTAVAVIGILSSGAMIVLLTVAPSRKWLAGHPASFAAPGQYPQPYPGGGYPAAANYGTGQVGGAGRWAADPGGRHQLRYYDGSAWTSWVSNAGVTSTDQH